MKTISKLLLVLTTIILISCGAKSNSEDNNIINKANNKEAIFYAISEDVAIDEDIITDMLVNHVDCDKNSGGICEELMLRIEENSLSFTLEGSELPDKRKEGVVVDGVFNIKGVVSIGGLNLIPAQWQYVYKEETKSFGGKLIFILNDIKIVMNIKGMI